MNDLSLNERVTLLAQRIGKECKKKLNKDVDATENVKGIVEIATLEEVKSGVDAVRVITPKLFKEALQALGYRKNPPGTLLHVITKSTVPPEGFLFLDGSQIPKAEYPTIDALGVFPDVKNDTSKIQLPNWDGRVGQTTNTPELVGTTIEDSLPTITGNINVYTWWTDYGYRSLYLTPHPNEIKRQQAATGTWETDYVVYRNAHLDASLSSAKYSETSKVQPAVFLHRTLIAY